MSAAPPESFARTRTRCVPGVANGTLCVDVANDIDEVVELPVLVGVPGELR